MLMQSLDRDKFTHHLNKDNANISHSTMITNVSAYNSNSNSNNTNSNISNNHVNNGNNGHIDNYFQ